jgi:hypothetical protein
MAGMDADAPEDAVTDYSVADFHEPGGNAK